MSFLCFLVKSFCRPGSAMVPVVPCRSITKCAPLLNYIHSCPADLQRHCARISSVMFHSSRWHEFKTTVAELCLPSSGSTARSSVYCRQASLRSFRRQRLPSHVTSSIVLHRHSRFSDSSSKHIPISRSYPGIVTWPLCSYCMDLAVIIDAVMRYLHINF